MFSADRYVAALRFAAAAHTGKKVPGTELPYLVHLTSVAAEVIAAWPSTLGIDGELAVVCALLHDSIEALRHSQRPRTRLVARQPAASLADALRRRGIEPALEDRAVIVPLDAERDAPDLLRGLLAEGIDVYACVPLRATLEDVFLERIGR